MTESQQSDQFWQTLIEHTDTQIDTSLLATLEHNARIHSPSTNMPRLIHLCGLPGSGKTTYAKQLKQQIDGYWHLQFDYIMESLHGYKVAQHQEGPQAAFAQWEKPAAQIGYRLLRTLVSEKRNILFDHSAAHPQHTHLLAHCKAVGYFIEMHYLDTPVAEVQHRVSCRETTTGRHTPERLIHERHAFLQNLLPIYRAQVDRFIVVGESAPSTTR